VTVSACDGEVSSALRRVDQLFGSGGAPRRRPLRRMRAEDVRDLQLAALSHPDPHVRRSCLGILDHYANDVSMAVFAQALNDDVEFVREVALHSIACEVCKQDDLCVADVVSPLLRVLDGDPKPDLRIKALRALFGLLGRDSRIPDALASAARTNTDRIVRECAGNAARGVWVQPKKRYQRRQRHHAAMGQGTL
jgi:HEAT repeat protein